MARKNSRAGIEYCQETGLFTRKGVELVNTSSERYERHCYLGKLEYAHRIAFHLMTGEWPTNEVDHVNGDGHDNRWSNLRMVKRHENMRHHYSKRFTGVSWNTEKRKWVAMIKADGVNRYLGRFDDWFEAVCARKSAEVRLWN